MEKKKKNVNTSNLGLGYAQMNEADFEKNLKAINFEGDFKKAHAVLKVRAKEDKDSQERKAKRLKK